MKVIFFLYLSGALIASLGVGYVIFGWLPVYLQMSLIGKVCAFKWFQVSICVIGLGLTFFVLDRFFMNRRSWSTAKTMLVVALLGLASALLDGCALVTLGALATPATYMDVGLKISLAVFGVGLPGITAVVCLMALPAAEGSLRLQAIAHQTFVQVWHNVSRACKG